MMFSRHDGPGQTIGRLAKSGFGLGLCLTFTLALAHPAGAAGDTLGETDPLPPPGTYIAAYVADSATGLPLAGAGVNFRNVEANFTVANTDSGGWAYVAQSGLPKPLGGSKYWVTAGGPGYISRMITVSACGSAASGPCVARFDLPRATANNSVNFDGTLLDSTTGRPIAGFPFDLSYEGMGGWVTYPSATDDSGRFVFTGIPKNQSRGYLWVNSPPRFSLWITVDMQAGGKTLLIPNWSTTSLAAPRERLRPAARHKSAPVILFHSHARDAAGRFRN
jgi:hypothetical protein